MNNFYPYTQQPDWLIDDYSTKLRLCWTCSIQSDGEWEMTKLFWAAMFEIFTTLDVLMFDIAFITKFTFMTMNWDLLPGLFLLWPQSNNSNGEDKPTTNIPGYPEIPQLQAVC